MTKHGIVRAAALGLAAAAVITVWNPPAQADTPTTLFVNNAATAHCSDAGSGTSAEPYCTISAAASVVNAGQTVQITGGTYPEQVTIDRSGTPGSPITFTGHSILLGTSFRITGQHDIVMNALSVSSPSSPSAIFDISDSSHIALTQVGVSLGSAGGFALHGVTDSTLTQLTVIGAKGSGIVLDAATSGVTIANPLLQGNDALPTTTAPLLDIAGSNDAIIDGRVVFAAGAGIAIEPSAVNAVIAQSFVSTNYRGGIVDLGATGTEIVNDSLNGNCGSSISIAAGATGASIENNIAAHSTATPIGCVTPPDQVEIGVYGDATKSTTVDYNSVFQVPSANLYAWGSPIATVAAFRSASAQGSHDANAGTGDAANVDSANSAAPGFQSLDVINHSREDDPAIPNTGAGPITYADRGQNERVQGSTAHVVVTPTLHAGTMSATADASASVTGWLPITSYTFAWGDGTTTVQAGPVATHPYATPGNYTVTVTVTDANRLGSVAVQLTYPNFSAFPLSLARDVSVAAGQSLSLNVIGPFDIQPGNATAVMVNLAVTSPAAAGTLTAYAEGTPRPSLPSLSFAAGQSASVLTLVPESMGTIDVFNSSTKAVSVSVEAQGWYQRQFIEDSYHSVLQQRLLNTTTPVKAGATVQATVPAMPSSIALRADDAVLRVTTSHATGKGGVQVFSTLGVQTGDQLIPIAAGVTSTNLVIVPLSSSVINLVNVGTGTADITVDLVGYYAGPSLIVAANPFVDAYQPASAAATSFGVPASGVKLISAGGAPGTSSAIVRIVAVGGTTAGNLQINYTSGSATLTWAPKQTIDQTLIVPLSWNANARITATLNTITLLNNSASPTTVTFQVIGYTGIS